MGSLEAPSSSITTIVSSVSTPTMTDIEEKVDAQHHDQTSFDLDQEAKAHTTNKNTQFSVSPDEAPLGRVEILTTHQPELTKALETCAIKPWSSTTIHYYVAVFCGLCCSYANGYDGSLMSAIEAMAFWQSHFNNIGTGGAMISLIVSYDLASAFGLCSSPVLHLQRRLFRRWPRRRLHHRPLGPSRRHGLGCCCHHHRLRYPRYFPKDRAVRGRTL